MTEPRRDPALEEQPDLDHADEELERSDEQAGDDGYDADLEDEDGHHQDDLHEDDVLHPRGRNVDFDTFMDEEGEDEGERPGWARRRWSSAALLVAVLLGALVVAVATWTWPDSEGPGDRLAEVELVGLSSTVGDALATVSDVDGRPMLRIDARDLPDVADGYAQVWMLDEALEGYVSVGILDAETTELWLPRTLDLTAYPIIEVSQEPFDGDPAHSGRTLWRGQVPPPGEPAGA
jgi:Anti-sigma-K factor rskA